MPPRSLTRSLRFAAVALLAAGILLPVIEAIVASRFPGYSYLHNYVSDLGVPVVGVFEGRPIDSPLAWLMNTGFVLQGLLALAGTLAVLRTTRGGAVRTVLGILAVAYAVGFTLIATVHGSAQSEEAGIVWLHLLGGSLAALAGNGALIVAGLHARRIGRHRALGLTGIVLGVTGLLSLVLLLVDKSGVAFTVLGEGALERGGLYSVMLGEVLAGVAIAAHSAAQPTGRLR